MGAYFKELKANYLHPALLHFNGGPLIESDFSGDYGGPLYSLVIYNTVDCYPSPAVSCISPTSNAWQLNAWMDQIQFIGGGGESGSLVAEGLGSAMQIFDDLKSRRHSSLANCTCQCILVCNSPPFSLPSMESGNYNGYSSEELVCLMSERNIKLSIVSPRKLAVLYTLYDKACGELQKTIKEYASDPRHLVLLSGFELTERSPGSDFTSPSHLQTAAVPGVPPTPAANSALASTATGTTPSTGTAAPGAMRSVGSPATHATQGVPGRGPQRMAGGSPSFKVPTANVPSSHSIASPGKFCSPVSFLFGKGSLELSDDKMNQWAFISPVHQVEDTTLTR